LEAQHFLQYVFDTIFQFSNFGAKIAKVKERLVKELKVWLEFYQISLRFLFVMVFETKTRAKKGFLDLLPKQNSSTVKNI